MSDLLPSYRYDLATAAHMDALDLAGAGVTEPLHRMALKHELNLVWPKHFFFNSSVTENYYINNNSLKYICEIS